MRVHRLTPRPPQVFHLCAAAAVLWFLGGLPCFYACAADAAPASGGTDRADLFAVAPVSSTPAASTPDTLRLSLDDAVARSVRLGEEMNQARSDRTLARGRYLQARSSALPQLTMTGSYTRQLESIFEGASGGPGPFEPDTTNPDLLARIRDLEEAIPGAGFHAISQLFSNSSFASENSWEASLDRSISASS